MLGLRVKVRVLVRVRVRVRFKVRGYGKYDFECPHKGRRK